MALPEESEFEPPGDAPVGKSGCGDQKVLRGVGFVSLVHDEFERLVMSGGASVFATYELEDGVLLGGVVGWGFGQDEG